MYSQQVVLGMEVAVGVSVGLGLKIGEGVAVRIEQFPEEVEQPSVLKKYDRRDLPSIASCKKAAAT